MTTFHLAELPYSYDALQPYMSAETLEYHHDKHHQAYVTNANKLLVGSGYEGRTIEEIIVSSHGQNPGVFNNASQHYNHAQFWRWMSPRGGRKNLPGSLDNLIKSDLGGFERMREDFINAGLTQFGSGWGWLGLRDGRLEIMKTPNGENPLIHGVTPLLGCDVWEHTYYIDYRNARPKYLEAWFDNLLNWDYVIELFERAS